MQVTFLHYPRGSDRQKRTEDKKKLNIKMDRLTLYMLL